jgi:Leucine-rich repeat (LRR) protein
MNKTIAALAYFHSLPDDIEVINITHINIDHLPDITRFKKLKELNCNNNKLVSLPVLPETLKILNCSNNKLTSLPCFPPNLKFLSCGNNELTSLPKLPENIKTLDCNHNKLNSLPDLPTMLDSLICSSNKLRSLPNLPDSLTTLFCCNNELTSLPVLSSKLQTLYCRNNKLMYLPELPLGLLTLNCKNTFICEIIGNDSLIVIRKKIQLLNKFRDTFYTLKFKKSLRKILWEKVREPHIMEAFHPKYLIENLYDENVDLDKVLTAW